MRVSNLFNLSNPSKPSSKRFSLRSAALTAPLVALGLMFATSADARPHKHQKMTPEQREAKFEERSKHMAERIRTKMAKRLELDAATTEQVVTILQDAMQERRTAMKAVHAKRKVLRELVKSKANDAAIDTAVANLRRAMEDVPKKDAVFDDMARILTPTQQAKFLLASNKMMRHHKGKRGKMSKADKMERKAKRKANRRGKSVREVADDVK